MCELLVGLPDVSVRAVGVRDDGMLEVHIEAAPAPVGCPVCGALAVPRERRQVDLVDMVCFGRPVVTVWHKRRFVRADPDCPGHSFTEVAPAIAARRKSMTDRVGRSMTAQVGRFARSVCGVASEHGCDWHTVNNAVMAYGGALVDDPDRYGTVEAWGSTRSSSPASAPTGARSTRPSLSTSPVPSCSTSSLVGGRNAPSSG
jgi:hypothetical protein